MSPAIPRRAFLVSGSLASLAASFVGAGACSRARRAPPAPGAGAWEPLAADLERDLPRWMADAAQPGLGLAVIRDARVVWQRGFGVADRDSNAPIDADTIFEVGSMSKPVFAYMVMKLHEGGVLDLDTPLVTYLADRLLVGDSRFDRITARHVLSHTSGLVNWRSGDAPLALQFTPGERWSYSGEGYYYLQSVVTHLAGRVNPNLCGTYEGGVKVCASDIDPFMKARLLLPFGMASSGYVWNDARAARTARPHDASAAPMPKAHPNAADAARYASAGGLHSSLADFAKFVIEVIDPRPADPFRLRADTIETMVRPVIPVSEQPLRSSWALGWQVLHLADGPVVAHGGDNAGFHSFAAVSRERRSGFIVMTNGDGGVKVIERLLYTPGMLGRLVDSSHGHSA
jgi:CubicO group peptidase (beta-lactamase class C family)